jgi:hypothetical protein
MISLSAVSINSPGDYRNRPIVSISKLIAQIKRQTVRIRIQVEKIKEQIE